MISEIHAENSPALPSQAPFWTRLVPYIGMFLLALLLWLPFGFKTTGLIEEIGINEQLDRGQQLFFSTPESVIKNVRMRPLQLFTFAAAFALDHDSYLFYNVFMLFFFFGKMVVVYWLVLQFLPGKKGVAFVTGVLYTLYPADTGLFALRTIHMHCAILAYLFAVYLFIQFWKRRSHFSSLALIGMSLSLIFSLAQYEVALAAAAVTPFLLLYFTRPNRRVLIGAAVWYVTMALVLGYAFWAAQQSTVDSYQGALLAQNSVSGGSLFSPDSLLAMLNAILVGYQRQVTGWATAFNKLNYLPFYWAYIGVGLVIFLGVLWWLFRNKNGQQIIEPISKRQYILMLLGGLVLFTLGIAVYLPLASHRLSDFRIYLLSMLGSAIILTIGLHIISLTIRRYSKILFSLLALPFVGLALLSAFQQQQTYVNFSLQQQSILQDIVEQAPQIKPNTAVLLIDRTGILDQPYGFTYGVYLATLMHYLYEDPTLESNYCASENRIPLTGFTCHFDQNRLRMVSSNNASGFAPPLNVSTDQLLIFSTKFGGGVHLLSAKEAADEFQVSGYNPQTRITGQVLPRRASTLFSCNPAMSCYKLPGAHSTSFDLPTQGEIGIGWRPTEDDGAGGTFRWAVHRVSSVDVDLSDSYDLSLDFKVLHWLDSAVMDSLKLTLNDSDIPLSFTPTDDGGRLYHATIPRSILVGQVPQMQLVFTIDHLSANQIDQPLGFALNWLRIRPL